MPSGSVSFGNGCRSCVGVVGRVAERLAKSKMPTGPETLVRGVPPSGVSHAIWKRRGKKAGAQADVGGIELVTKSIVCHGSKCKIGRCIDDDDNDC